jgi:hypothetical protein
MSDWMRASHERLTGLDGSIPVRNLNWAVLPADAATSEK